MLKLGLGGLVDGACVGRAPMSVEADVLHVVVAGPVQSLC
jgi:hypothetical protein